MTKYVTSFIWLYLQINIIDIGCVPVKLHRVLELTENFSVAIRLLSHLNSYSCITNTTRVPTHTYIHSHACKLVRNNQRISGFHDVKSVSDRVNKQYLALPYPPVSIQTLKDEVAYYKQEIRDIPFEFIPPLSLEAINHYLFKGLNHFRCGV